MIWRLLYVRHLSGVSLNLPMHGDERPALAGRRGCCYWWLCPRRPKIYLSWITLTPRPALQMGNKIFILRA
jgi:hypothetical protein